MRNYKKIQTEKIQSQRLCAINVKRNHNKKWNTGGRDAYS